MIGLLAALLLTTAAGSDASAPLESARKALQSGDYASAAAAAERALSEEGPAGIEARLLLARAVEVEDPRRALVLYEEHVRAAGFGVHGQTSRLRVEILSQGIRRGELDALSDYLKILRLREAGRFRAAVAAGRHFPSRHRASGFADDAAHLVAYILLVDAGDAEAAEKAYEEFLRSNPGSAYTDSALYGLGSARQAEGKPEAARRVFQELLARHTLVRLPFGALTVPRDSYVSRLWFSRAERRLATLDAMGDDSPADAPPVALGLGSRLYYDTPVGSGAGHRSLWSLATEAGLTPTFITHWITRDTDWRWETPDRLLACVRSGRVPVLAFWYFGDEIGPSFVAEHREAYLAVVRDRLVPLVRDLPDVLVILEPEFNKNGIPDSEAWSDLVREVVAEFRTGAPRARVGLGFGDWGDYQLEPERPHLAKAVEACDFTAFSLMLSATTVAATLDPAWSLAHRVDRLADHLSTRYRKPLYLAYLAVSSTGAWEERQAGLIGQLFDALPDLSRHGVFGAAYFALNDDPSQRGWFQEEERGFGLLRATGEEKPAMAKWRDGERALLARDAHAPTLDGKLGVTRAEGALTVRGRLSEWSRWTVEIRGVLSGASWTRTGAGRRVYAVWQGEADVGRFEDEPCRIAVTWMDRSGNSGAASDATRAILRPPARNLLALTGKAEIQVWGAGARKTVTGDGARLALPGAHSGARFPVPAGPGTLDLSHARAQGWLEFDIGRSSSSEGVLLAFEDARGFRVPLLLDAFVPLADLNAPRTITLPLSTWTAEARTFADDGAARWSDLDWHRIAAVTLETTTNAVDLTFGGLRVLTPDTP